MATRLQFDSSDIGAFSKLTNAYSPVTVQGSTNFYSVFEAELGEVIPVVRTSIGGTHMAILLPATVTASLYPRRRRTRSSNTFAMPSQTLSPSSASRSASPRSATLSRATIMSHSCIPTSTARQRRSSRTPPRSRSSVRLSPITFLWACTAQSQTRGACPSKNFCPGPGRAFLWWLVPSIVVPTLLTPA